MTVARLAEAVRAGDLREVDLMLRTRPELADMSMSAGDEHRPLHFAVMSRRPEMVRLLMEYGASARKGIHPHREATSAFTIATEREYDEIVAIIEEAEQLRRPVDIVTAEPEPVRDGAKTARTAVAEGDAEWLRARHAEGLLVNEVDFSHGGLLTVAVQHDRAEILKMLLELGFDPNERGRAGEGAEEYFSYAYPLWHAAAAGRLDMIDMLLDYGADPNLHVCASGSPVYSAYSHRQWEAAELLKRRGGEVTPDIAAIYRDTESARRMLAQSDDSKVAEELLTFGAMGGDPEIVRMALERLHWTPDDSRWFYIFEQPLSFWNHIPWLYAGNKDLPRDTYIECFHLILPRCGPNVRGGFGRTMLHEVAAAGDHVTDEELAPFAGVLLEAGARMNVRDDILKSTPLGWACRWGRAGVVKMLLDAGADPVEADAEPWATPAAWARTSKHPDIVVLLDRS